MGYRSTALLVLVMGPTLAITGCATKYPGCEMRYVKGNEYDLQGIKIPVSYVPAGLFEIGKLKYTGPQVQALSEAVSAMDISRQTTCAIINSKSFETLSPAYREKTFDRLAAIGQAMVDLGKKLSSAPTPEAGVRAAEAQLQIVKDIAAPAQPSTPPSSPTGSASAPVGGPSAPKIGSVVDDAARQEVAALKTRLEGLTADVSALKATGTMRIKVEAFDTNGVALPAVRREALFAEVRSAFTRLPAGRTPNVLVIGFSDGQGARTYNVALALRRAESVAELLRKQDFGRDFHTEVTSGGIYGRGSGAQGRRVDIIVSRAYPASLNS